MDDFMHIRMRHQQGDSIRSIAEDCGFSRNTVRKILRQKAPKPYHRPASGSLFDPFHQYAVMRVGDGMSATRIFEEICKMGFTGSYDLVLRHLRPFRRIQHASVRATVRFETPPGQQAQCDWAEIGRFPDAHGNMRRIYAFVLILGFSRMLYLEFTLSMALSCLIRCHINAFDYFGGWTRHILYDNMRQVVVGPQRINPLFLDFATHYDIVVKRCRPYRPRTKGKVERAVDYLKDNFLKGRSFDSLAHLQMEGRHWLDQVANVRIHATTGKRPVDLLKEEQLIPIATISPYQIVHCVQRRVGVEGFVQFDNTLYSVPIAHVGQRVHIEALGGRILVRQGDSIIASHHQATQPNSRIEDPEHIRQRWQLCQPDRNPSDRPLCHVDLANQHIVPSRDLNLYQLFAQ
jgi:transposase